MSPDELIREIDRMTPMQRRRVLAYARGLVDRVVGEPGENLRAFAGVLSEHDARQMAQAVEDGCERIDRDAW